MEFESISCELSYPLIEPQESTFHHAHQPQILPLAPAQAKDPVRVLEATLLDLPMINLIQDRQPTSRELAPEYRETLWTCVLATALTLKIMHINNVLHVLQQCMLFSARRLRGETSTTQRSLFLLFMNDGLAQTEVWQHPSISPSLRTFLFFLQDVPLEQFLEGWKHYSRNNHLIRLHNQQVHTFLARLQAPEQIPAWDILDSFCRLAFDATEPSAELFALSPLERVLPHRSSPLAHCLFHWSEVVFHPDLVAAWSWNQHSQDDAVKANTMTMASSTDLATGQVPPVNQTLANQQLLHLDFKLLTVGSESWERPSDPVELEHSLSLRQVAEFWRKTPVFYLRHTIPRLSDLFALFRALDEDSQASAELASFVVQTLHQHAPATHITQEVSDRASWCVAWLCVYRYSTWSGFQQYWLVNWLAHLVTHAPLSDITTAKHQQTLTFLPWSAVRNALDVSLVRLTAMQQDKRFTFPKLFFHGHSLPPTARHIWDNIESYRYLYRLSGEKSLQSTRLSLSVPSSSSS